MNRGGFRWRRVLAYVLLILAANYMYFLGLMGVHTWEHPLSLLPFVLTVFVVMQLLDIKPRARRVKR